MWIEAYFKSFVVVGIYAETRYETVNHQIDVLIHVGLSAGKWLARIEQ
jgi:hypothetical protein